MEEHFYNGEVDPSIVTTLQYSTTTIKNPFKSISVTASQTMTYMFYYDNHPTPLGNLLDPNAATHNVIKIERTIGELSTTTTFSYDYNAAGYPVARTSSDGDEAAWGYNCK